MLFPLVWNPKLEWPLKWFPSRDNVGQVSLQAKLYFIPIAEMKMKHKLNNEPTAMLQNTFTQTAGFDTIFKNNE